MRDFAEVFEREQMVGIQQKAPIMSRKHKCEKKENQTKQKSVRKKKKAMMLIQARVRSEKSAKEKVGLRGEKAVFRSRDHLHNNAYTRISAIVKGLKPGVRDRFLGAQCRDQTKKGKMEKEGR